jgi:ribosome recycling factor
MAYNFNPFKDKVKNNEDWLKKEYTSIRTGQASPAVLDSVQVEAYGSFSPISQIASIGLEDARTIKITPWDTTQLKDIERAIIGSSLGLSARTDETCVRVSFPALTQERRDQLIKLAKEKLEEAKITVRKEREKVIKDIEAQKKAGTISEDEARRNTTELQKYVDQANVSLEQLRERKEKEILQ